MTAQHVFQLASLVSLAVWIYLLFARGRYWKIKAVDTVNAPDMRKRVIAIIPARNEEATLAEALSSLLLQDYRGELSIVLVDDHSADQTSLVAERTAAQAGASHRVKIIRAAALPPGWTGKLWAISEGLKFAELQQPDYLLLTDADVVHAPDNVRTLVARAEDGGLDLVSLMVKLHCRSLAERALIPAFVYFFFQLYPPDWIASRHHSSAGAAGGCMLIRREALDRIGGIQAIRSELIDDCALASRVKEGGPIWLGTSSATRSIREYGSFGEIHRMIARTAFTQLNHSGVLLIATILGIAIVYLAPPLLAWTGDSAAMSFGLAAWMLMIVSFAPMLCFYGRSFFWAPLLPLIALFYLSATVDSAVRYWSGRGGQWKGRVQDAR